MSELFFYVGRLMKTTIREHGPFVDLLWELGLLIFILEYGFQ